MESYVFYKSFHEAMKGLSDEQYGKIMRIINEYSLDGVEPEINDVIVNMAFQLIKPQIDANTRRRENGKKGGDFGKMGGRPKKTPMGLEKNEIKTPNVNINENANENSNVNDNENVNDNANAESDHKDTEKQQGKSSRFQKPTLEEVQSYIREKHLSFSAQRFFDYYESKGWTIGKSPMKNWKAACGTWERNAQNFSPHATVSRDSENLNEYADYFLNNGGT